MGLRESIYLYVNDLLVSDLYLIIAKASNLCICREFAIEIGLYFIETLLV